MKIVKLVIILTVLFQVSVFVTLGQNAQGGERDFSIQISGFQSSSDRFVFTDHRNTTHTFDSNGTKNWGRFAVGSNFSIRQTSGPRPCRLINDQGSVSTTISTMVLIDCAARYVDMNISIFGFQSSSDRFIFKDHANRDVIFDSNQTRKWGSFVVGTNYSLTQSSGPRTCRINNAQGVVPTGGSTINIDCSGATNVDMHITISGFQSNGDRFIFKDHANQQIVFDSNGTKRWGSFPRGTSYNLTQVSGPRTCRISNVPGVVPAGGATIDISCAAATTNVTFKAVGIQTGESFTFTDHNNRAHTLSRDGVTNWNMLPRGSNYSLRQANGPRQCRLTNGEGIIPNTNFLEIMIDCTPTTTPTNPPTNPPTTPTTPTTPAPMGKFGDFDLSSRSTDQKSFAAFNGTTNAVVGGVDGVGEKEGQFVAYMTSWNVDPKHGGRNRQIMWFNRGNGVAAVVSAGPDGMGANKDSYEPAIDVTGKTVVFESTATNIDPNDTNNVSDIFIWRLVPSAETTCVTCNGNAASISPSISRGGAHVAFVSNASNLAPGVDGTNTGNVYVKDMGSGQVTLISMDPKTKKGVGGRHPSISEDGSRVAFYSYSNKLVEGDKNNLWDIFVWQRGNPKLKRISMTGMGGERDQASESASRVVKPTISGDGRYVAFSTTATNMGGAANGKTQQVYVAEVETGRVIRVSEGTAIGDGDSPAQQGEFIAISYDGTWVAFTTKATNLGGKIVLKNIHTGEIVPFKIDGSGSVATPSLSRNGKCIAFPASEQLDKRFKSSGVFTACRE